MAHLHVNNLKLRYQLTHMLRIPLATSKSRAQFQASLRRALTDPASGYIHGDAFVQPDSLSLNLGTLSLSEPKLSDNAIDLLRGLDLPELLQSSIRQLPSPKTMLSIFESLQTSIIGLEEPPFLSHTGRLYAPVIDPYGTKARFFQAIRAKFFAAELMKVGYFQSIDGWPMHIRIVNNVPLRSTIKNEKPSIMYHYSQKGIVAYERPKFDVQEFYSKYRNFTWAQDFQLERLAISEIQPVHFVRDGRLVGRGYRDIASVPLPGAPDVDLEANMKGVTYQPVKTIYNIVPHARYDVASR